jgi:hypothetical protein
MKKHVGIAVVTALAAAGVVSSGTSFGNPLPPPAGRCRTLALQATVLTNELAHVNSTADPEEYALLQAMLTRVHNKQTTLGCP